MRALQIFAGPRARRHLRERGLRAQDVALIAAAAGGPKGLVLNVLDRYLFGQWLGPGSQPVHLLGASIGAWRMATACLPDPARAFERMAHAYIHQRYAHAPGRAPRAAHVSAVFGAILGDFFAGHEHGLLRHPRYRLHVFASHGRHVLGREGRLRTPLGYLGAFAANAASRTALGAWLERVIFSDPRDPLPLVLHDYPMLGVALTPQNLLPSLLASCSIPFWLDAVHDIPGAPAGAYWDGGITDYHLHLPYATLARCGDEQEVPSLVLYPHFQRQLVPGWLDKGLPWRHRATPWLDNVVLLVPQADWIRTLPNAKLPDRGDFQRYGDDFDARRKAWQRAVDESERLVEEFDQLQRRGTIEALAL